MRLGSVQDGVILPLTARVISDDVVMNVAPILSRVREIRRVTSGTTLEQVGNLLWLTVWNGPQLVHSTRRLPAAADLTGELLRSLHPLRVASPADVAIDS